MSGKNEIQPPENEMLGLGGVICCSCAVLFVLFIGLSNAKSIHKNGRNRKCRTPKLNRI